MKNSASKKSRISEARQKARQTELKARPEIGETVYDITLKQAEFPACRRPPAKRMISPL